MSQSLVVNEIYLSVQGESTLSGLPCIFVRLTGCDLRCSYCDTAYAFSEGKRMRVEEIVARVSELAVPYRVQPAIGRLPLVELTGGEPLLQSRSIPLMGKLCDEGFTVLLETSGAHDVSGVDLRVRRIMDLKCPSSGEASRMRWENLSHLKSTDEVKFVIATEQDYQWAAEQISRHRIDLICPILFSWAAPLSSQQKHASLKPMPEGQTAISRQELVEWIIRDALPVRFQLQIHKVIWSPDARAV